MGLFTFCVSATLVILQATTILLDRPESAWTFNLVHVSMDVHEWKPSLDRILSSGDPLLSPEESSDGGSGAGANRTLLIAKQAGPLLCLQAVSERLLQGSKSQNAGSVNASDPVAILHRARLAYGCILHSPPPRAPSEVLDAFNPHLLLLTLCCMQLMVALGRIDYAHDHAPTPASIMLMALNIPLYSAGVALCLLLLAACAVQGVHDASLLRYPTLLVIALYVAMGAVYALAVPQHNPDFAWELIFHLQAVAVPTAVLAFAVYGTRQWTDLFCYILVLCAAVNLLWLQLQADEHAPVLVVRLVILGLLATVLHTVHVSFGPYDDWRYVATFIACIGLAPLFLLSVVPGTRPETWSHSGGPGGSRSVKAYHALSLTASNAALFCLCVSFSALF
jgi:hypothetical protein